jgi:GcrA cell cycle regulator
MTAPLGNAHNLRWAAAHDAALAKHLAADMSMSEAAAAINGEFETVYSRNAVIGRANRLGLKSNVPKSHGSRKQKRFHGGERHKPERKIVIKQVFQCDAATGLRTADVVPRMIPLIELAPGDCRWPYGDGPFLFCGVAGCVESYCDAHQALSIGHPWREATDTQRATIKRNTRPAIQMLSYPCATAEDLA